MRPQPTAATVPLVFSNESGARREISSLDAQGRRVPARTLEAGQSYTQTANIGAVWLVSAGGACVAITAVVAPALVIVSAGRTSLIPLFAIRGRVTDARSGSPLSAQTVYIWKADDASCAVVGGAGSPGYVVSSISSPAGGYEVYVTAGDYKVRVATSPVGGVSFRPQWWKGKVAGPGAQCLAADVLKATADQTGIDFALQEGQ
jgi:hypothetical protein